MLSCQTRHILRLQIEVLIAFNIFQQVEVFISQKKKKKIQVLENV